MSAVCGCKWHPLTGGRLVVLQVQLAEAFERFWGRFGDRHLCVSNAMRDELQKHWNIKATVFYDRPPAQFEPTPLVQKVCVCQSRPGTNPGRNGKMPPTMRDGCSSLLINPCFCCFSR